ncbi:uncharacterized protein TEOVI_000009000 [Trypanosoma equiperdum]|uniref:Uncharacterized protein n=1 Tax=Trypanosoma equiperdum TaxID=5694 RepID=A0A1G4HYH8_TRYEQ|nr:hypothetical protein, conserved [Trypanosoma equiperdum]
MHKPVTARVTVSLRFTGVPGIQGQRVFRDTLSVTHPYDNSYDRIRDVVNEKLKFMKAPLCDFTVFHKDNKTNDVVVVDNAYFAELVRDLVGKALALGGTRPASIAEGVYKLGETRDFRRNEVLGGSFDYEEEGEEVVSLSGVLSFDVEVTNEKTVVAKPSLNSGTVVPLTTEALRAHVSDGVHVAIGSLVCPPKHPNVFIRAAVIGIHFKQLNSGQSLCRLDLCEPEDVRQQITAVTFDASVQKAIRDNLKGGGREVVELRNAYIRKKNETDIRYQVNMHPLIIGMNSCSRIEVVRLLPAPVALNPENVVTMRENLRPTGIINFGGPAVSSEKPVNSSLSQPMRQNASATGSSSSSSVQSGPRKTMLSLNSAASNTITPISGVVPSHLGEEMRRQQANFLSKRTREEPLPKEPDTIHVSVKDVRMRDMIVAQYAVREEETKNRIRRRKEVNQTCIICGVNCEDESTLTLVADLLKNNSENRGRRIPSMAELRWALCDRRQTKSGQVGNRLVCAQYFVDTRTNSLHVVHCRCAHLCTGYQRGRDLEDIVALELPMQTCTLCGMPGASVFCYHPDCREMYHTICALFCFGYVNFGKKDPHLPCPARPKHTQVKHLLPDEAGPVTYAQSNSAWWEEDKVVFDSSIVETTDLRDPDENEGA